MAVFVLSKDSIEEPTTKLPQKASIFDDESDFMKGFEAGLMISSKKNDQTLSDFGCEEPEIAHEYQHVFDNIKSAVTSAKVLLPNSNV